jgi:N4-gp56 family major capsid protein
MARTSILPTDPLKRKAWAAKVAEDSAKEQYYARLIGPEGSRSALVKKTDTEAGAGDEVVTALVAKLRGTPITEGQKLAGNEFKLSTASHTMRVNEFRQGVNVGARIEQSRVGFNLKRQGRDRLTEYITEFTEEVITMALAGHRGVGSEIQHFPTGWVGYPNAFRAPDTAHTFVGTDNTHTGGAGGTMTTSDLVAMKTITRLRTKAKKMLGGQPQNAVKIQPIRKAGRECYVLPLMPEQIQDFREDTGAQAWFEAQKALIQNMGKEAEFFKGGAGYFNGILVDECDTGVKFTNYGAGSNVPAARSLMLGANAGCVAFGTKGMADGMTVGLDEDTDDRGHDAILTFEIIFGADKTAFNGMDYGSITLDTAFTAAA